MPSIIWHTCELLSWLSVEFLDEGLSLVIAAAGEVFESARQSFIGRVTRCMPTEPDVLRFCCRNVHLTDCSFVRTYTFVTITPTIISKGDLSIEWSIKHVRHKPCMPMWACKPHSITHVGVDRRLDLPPDQMLWPCLEGCCGQWLYITSLNSKSYTQTISQSNQLAFIRYSPGGGKMYLLTNINRMNSFPDIYLRVDCVSDHLLHTTLPCLCHITLNLSSTIESCFTESVPQLCSKP